MGQSKFAVVTAGAKGIGRATAKMLVESGWTVAITDVDVGAGEAAAREFGCAFHACDMGDSEAIEALFATFPTVSLLVNNAGIAGPTLSVRDMPVAEWKRTFDINVTGHFVAAKCVLQGMLAARHGVIVNLASVAARIGYPNRSPYAASKWAVLGFTASLAREVGEDGIRVNAILPGAIRGERMIAVVEAYAEANGVDFATAEAQFMGRQANRRMIEPEEVAAMILYLASDAARSVTGEFIGVNGGFE